MNGAGSKRSFSIVPLPKEWTNHTILVQASNRYRDFRLQSLQLSPEAYGSTYEWEVQFPREVWEQRLQDKNVTYFIATNSQGCSEVEETKAQEENWTGMIVLHENHTEEGASASKGPWSYNQSRPPAEKATCEGSHSATWYQLNGIFVHPSLRRLGLGRELIRAALAYVKQKLEVSGSASASAKVVIVVDTWNKGAIGLYSSCGFVITSEDDYDVKGSKRRAFLTSLMLYADHEGMA